MSKTESVSELVRQTGALRKRQCQRFLYDMHMRHGDVVINQPSGSELDPKLKCDGAARCAKQRDERDDNRELASGLSHVACVPMGVVL